MSGSAGPKTPVYRASVGRPRISDVGRAGHRPKVGRWFGIGIMRITDAGLEHLKSLPNLERLDINLTRVTDAGPQTLKGFKQLRWLDLPVMETTPEGIADLKRTLPDCQFTGSWSW